jgi:hypothetical protein
MAPLSPVCDKAHSMINRIEKLIYEELNPETKNDLPQTTRRKAIDLDQSLADILNLGLEAKQAIGM